MTIQKSTQEALDPGKMTRNAMEIMPDQAPFASNRSNLEFLITNILQRMRIPAHINGYLYLRRAILLEVECQDAEGMPAKILFSEVAQHFNTTPDRVDRAIRYALSIAWSQCDFASLQKAYSFAIRFVYDKPTNMGFIACVADYFRLMLKCEVNPHIYASELVP